MPEEQVPSQAGEPEPALPRGGTIGRYVVLGLVGRGGMGEVYAAYDPELDRKIAVKLLRARSSADADAAEGKGRLLREAQVIARLSHANVVVVYDVGTFGDSVFLAMEFIDGHTLAYWRHAGQRSWKDVLRVFRLAGLGLAAAHHAGLVHRDFKPDNVMVGHDGTVRVMDFGLAREIATGVGGAAAPAGGLPPVTATAASAARATAARATTLRAAAAPGSPDDQVTQVISAAGARPLADPDSPPSLDRALDSNLTPAGALLGTPAYMAPEQLAGQASDARTDQFSFCVSLYEALYDLRPFAGKTLLALMDNVAAGRVRDPPAGSAVPSWVRRVVVRGLRAAPEDRYPSMRELLSALQRDPGVVHRRWALRAGGFLLLTGLAFGASRRLQARRPPCEQGGEKLRDVWEEDGADSPRKSAIRAALGAAGQARGQRTFGAVTRILDLYVTEWTAIYAEACVATVVRGEQSAEVLDLRMSCLNGRLDALRALTNVFLRADSQVVDKAVSAAHALAPLERCSDVTILRAVVKPPDDPAARARALQLRRRLAEVKALGDAGRVSDALTRARPLVDEARALGYLPVTAEALLRLGWLNLGRPAEAETIMDQAIWSAEASGDDELFAEAASVQGFVVGYLEGHPDRAQPWLRVADAVLHRIGGHEVQRAWLLNNQGAVLVAQGRYEDGLVALGQSAALKEKLLGPDDPDVAAGLANLGVPLAKLRRFDEAMALNDRALRIYEKNGADYLELPIHLSSRGEYLNALGRFAEAEAPARRALQIWEEKAEPDNAYLGAPLTVLGLSYLGQDRPAEAVPPLERAYAVRRRLDPDPVHLGETAFALGQALWRSQGNRRRARALASEAERWYARTPDAQPGTEIRRWLRRHQVN